MRAPHNMEPYSFRHTFSHDEPFRPRATRRNMPFDPEELSRRLRVVQAERQRIEFPPRAPLPRRFFVSAAQRQEQEAAAAKYASAHATQPPPNLNPNPNPSNAMRPAPPHPSKPYVPTEAATQFLRTTTKNPPHAESSHLLSRTALHNLCADAPDATSIPAATALSATARQDTARREHDHKRNQFQRSSMLELAVEKGEAERRASAKRSSFGLRPLSPMSSNERTSNSSRFSGHEDEYGLLPVVYNMHAGRDDERDSHRVDWSQNDEAAKKPRTRASISGLKNRLSIGGGGKKHMSQQQQQHQQTSSVGETQHRSGLLWRLKK